MRNCVKLLFIFILISLFTLLESPVPLPRGFLTGFSVSCVQAKEKNIARDFRLEDLNQKTFSLSNYKDKQPVILFFWTTWCPFCRNELRALKDIYPELAQEGWELFAINVGESASQVEGAVKGYGLNFKVLLDKDTTVAEAYGILGVPTYFLVDKQGYAVFNDHYFPKGKYKGLVSQ